LKGALNSIRLDRFVNKAQVGTRVFHLLGICTGSTTRMVLLANSAPFLLTLVDNKIGALLKLSENELTLIDNSLQTAGLTHFDCK
jgi:hypothetical protein